ncbi:hypothetical protein V7S57_22715 [Caulobacter sp. CCNWLY153]|jgi:hypothetical protein|uniref:Uncharacterized protein n=1 Tax=Caulobacter radicis TaxID=2172650 RepID=A0A2T9JQ14_9CAUL|nr:hypothetical protein [Caulobacter radicis]PVM85784.1 hypothetical protein DDF65_06510 [Caulobacter radicis]
MRAFVVSALISIAVAGSAAAQTAAPTDAAAPAVADKKAEKKKDSGVVCRRERVVGSNRPVRICTTAAQRDTDKEAARTLLDGRAPNSTDAPDGGSAN